MALMGPRGMSELGQSITAKANYTIERLNRIEGIQAPVLKGAHFKEFVVNLDDINLTVAAVNKSLYRKHGIVGGKDLSVEYPELGQSALFCVTEAHTLDDIERLIAALTKIAKGGGIDV
jgi:glycine dehydrogenase subunit 1